MYPDGIETSFNVVSGFRTCGIYPFNPDVVLSKRPDSQPLHNSVQDHVSSAVIEILKMNRSGNSNILAKKIRKRKITVKPCKSVTLEDINWSDYEFGHGDSISNNSFEGGANGNNQDINKGSSSNSNCQSLEKDASDSDNDGQLFISVGYYYVVLYCKKEKLQHYIGKVMAINSDDTYDMKFLRRVKNQITTFVWPTLQQEVPIFVVNSSQVVESLNMPLEGKREVLIFCQKQLEKYSKTLI